MLCVERSYSDREGIDESLNNLPYRFDPTQIDRKLADTHIDLEHLANMAGLGVEKTGEDDADSEQLAEQLIVLANRMVAKRKEEMSNHSY